MAQQKSKRVYITYFTEIGASTFVYINGRRNILTTPDGKKVDKGYTVTMNLSKESYEKMKADFTKVWEESEECKALMNTTDDPIRPYLPLKMDKAKGIYSFEAKTKATFPNSDGTVRENVIKIVDGECNPLPAKTNIWQGSKILLEVALSPYKTGSGYGVSAKLRAIQLIELAQPTQRKVTNDDGEEEIQPSFKKIEGATSLVDKVTVSENVQSTVQQVVHTPQPNDILEEVPF